MYHGELCPALAVQGSMVWIASPASPVLRRFSLEDLTTTSLTGPVLWLHQSKAPAMGSLETMAQVPGALLALRDGSLLIVDTAARRVLRLRLAHGLDPAEVAVVASTGAGEDAPVPDALDPNTLAVVNGMTELEDGSILVSDKLKNRILMIKAGVVSVWNSGVDRNGSLGRLKDGSVLIAPETWQPIERVSPAGTLTIFAGGRYSGPNFSQAPSEYPLALPKIKGLTVASDGSVLVSVKDFDLGEDGIFRLKDGLATLLLGDKWSMTYPLDRAFHRGSSPTLTPGPIPVLPDGSLLLPYQKGVWLFSPNGAFQEMLEQVVEQGKAAARAGHQADYRAAVVQLTNLTKPVQANLRTLNREGREDRLKGNGPAIIADLVRSIREYADNPGEHFRARLALADLKAYKASLAPAGSAAGPAS
jgi:hypothetical protein